MAFHKRQEVRTDILIVGAGLAGSILAWRLLQAGIQVQLLHNPERTAASRVAAGLVNPITGQRLVLQKNIEALLPAAKELYQQLEEKFHRQFFFTKDMLRSLQHDKARKAWEKRQHDPAYQEFISEVKGNADTILQHQTGYLDTNALLDTLHTYFQEQACITATDINDDDIYYDTDHIQWQHITAKTLIYCRGWREINGKYFSFLPFQPAKGEILHLLSQKELPKHIINQGKWLLPIDQQHCKIGATYQPHVLNEQPTQAAKQQLLAALKRMPVAQEDIEICHHQAGIRPNTLDKQPFLGRHPEYPNIAIFNGFGSKGSLLIPWYSQRMCEHLIHHAALPAHADIQRFVCA